ncbi:PKD domain containing protein [Actinoplanes sp. NPDC051470]|uniref:PKD domain containing protein n=1 Tax=unclassified Actinoplanes TaxID=2626549 RepID=UPI00344840F7
MRRRLSAAATALLAVTGLAATAAPAAADLAQPKVVSVNPVDYTPHVQDGTVWAITVVGDTVVVGGSFTQVTNSAKTQTYARRNVFAYGLNDGAVRPFAPAVDGAVYALAPGAGNTVYLGGAFKTVSGAAQRGLARVSLASGQRLSSFTAKQNWGDARALAVRGKWLYAGGTFSAINGTPRAGLARMNALTGAVDAGFDAKLSAPGLDRTRVEHFDVTADGSKLIAVGALLKSGTADRTQIALFDVAGATASLSSWYTDAYKPECMKGFDTYLRQVKFSPDGKYFVVAATGRASSAVKLCDSAARFEVAPGKQNPTWVQRTGGDSLYAVAVTGAAVYLGGHQRYLDNPYGSDAKGPGPGAVKREGIGAVSPTTGKALPWDPTRSRGVGVRALIPTSNGLLVGSDTDKLGKEYHGRVGMFPLN